MKELIENLKKNNETIASMESCTGGAFANAITDIEGAGDVFHYSAVTYTNDSKIKMGVSENIISLYTVYSMETVKEMSRAIVEFTDADYGVGITGKLGRQDSNNLYGDNTIVYISIYQKKTKEYKTKIVKPNAITRREKKKEIINTILKLFQEG